LPDFSGQLREYVRLDRKLRSGGLFVATKYDLPPVGARVDLAIHVGPEDRLREGSAAVVPGPRAE